VTVVRGGRVVLREATEADVPALRAIVATPEVARWWVDEHEEDMLERVTDDDPDRTVFAVLVDGEVAGLVDTWEESEPAYRHAEIDVFLDPARHGRGLGADAVRTAARWLFDERGHHRITIDPAAGNATAIRSYERVGFKPVGVMRRYERGDDGTWHDGLLMDLLREDLR
jgi:aminoglycoside 6'-N-acetyltransferase